MKKMAKAIVFETPRERLEGEYAWHILRVSREAARNRWACVEIHGGLSVLAMCQDPEGDKLSTN